MNMQQMVLRRLRFSGKKTYNNFKIYKKSETRKAKFLKRNFSDSKIRISRNPTFPSNFKHFVISERLDNQSYLKIFVSSFQFLKSGFLACCHYVPLSLLSSFNDPFNKHRWTETILYRIDSTNKCSLPSVYNIYYTTTFTNYTSEIVLVTTAPLGSSVTFPNTCNTRFVQ